MHATAFDKPVMGQWEEELTQQYASTFLFICVAGYQTLTARMKDKCQISPLCIEILYTAFHLWSCDTLMFESSSSGLC